MRLEFGLCIWSLAILFSLPVSAYAQAEAPLRLDLGQAVGVRAAGMGGAFTAVADDASAVFWNPAGFASGSFFSLVADANLLDRRSGGLVALGTPPLGLSYYRTTIAREKNGRNTLVTHHAGVSLVQSVGGRLALGTTLRFVRGIADSPGGTAGGSVATNKFDADVGVMTTGSLGQLGLSIRNLLQPEFKAPGGAIRLDRHVRAGVSIHAGQNTTVAADVDLTAAKTPRGDSRDAALGVEAHPVRKAWVRGGVHWNASGTSDPIGSVGASYVVYGSAMADAQVSFGPASGDRGWGIGLRMVF